MVNVQFDPFRERLVNLELAADDARTRCDLWSLISGMERAQQLDDQQKDAIRALIGSSGEAEFNDECQKSAKKLAGIRSQLSALVVGVSDILSGFTSRIEQGEELFETSNYHAGVRNLLNAEWEFSAKIKDTVRVVNKIIKQRLDDKSYPQIAVIDLLVTQIYGQLLSRVTDEQAFAGIPTPLVPSAWLGPVFPGRAATEALSGLPLSVLHVDESVCSDTWELVKVYGEIGRGIYKDFNLDRDMNMLLRGISPSLSPLTSGVLNIALRDLVADIIGTLIGGPAFVSALIEREAYTAEVVCGSGNIASPKLPTYFKWMVLCGVLRTMGFPVESEMLQGVIVRLYGPPDYASRIPTPQPILSELMVNLNPITESILQWPLSAFAQGNLPQVLPAYTRQIHQRALSVCEELTTRGGPLAQPQQLKKDEKNEAIIASAMLSSKQRKQTKGFGKPEPATISTEVHSTIAGIRFAFEGVSIKLEDLAGLRKTSRETCVRFLDNFYGSPEGRFLQRKLSEDEAREVVRKYKSASTRSTYIAPGNIFQLHQ